MNEKDAFFLLLTCEWCLQSLPGKAFSNNNTFVVNTAKVALQAKKTVLLTILNIKAKHSSE